MEPAHRREQTGVTFGRELWVLVTDPDGIVMDPGQPTRFGARTLPHGTDRTRRWRSDRKRTTAVVRNRRGTGHFRVGSLKNPDPYRLRVPIAKHPSTG